MKARLLLNPASGGGRGARLRRRLERRAAAAGLELVVSLDAADLTERARRAAAEGVERLLVAGGDGSQHHALQGLAGTACALAPLPVGRGNDLAASLGVPARIEAALASALAAPVRRIDLGRATSASGASRLFAVYCGVGFDSEVALFVRRTRLVRGRLAYVYGVFRTLLCFEPPEAVVLYDGGGVRGPVMFAVAANGPRFGGGMRIAPEARLDDGSLELVTASRVSRLELLRVFPRVYRGTHVTHPAITTRRSRRLRVELDRELTMVGDGEPMFPVGPAGVEIEVLPGALRVIAPG